ncbi:DUF948 domain-containing protein [Sporosarcina sp. Sa2YVA2]|uniref:DUF948 domain-containing protein n=1 Tax=Sporosarcina quadrami TaxID=2762234 RepID=A0ABR8U5D3_9BACL|nr:DUF948 domain-containing protein [Sporosarcina quadrami]MBD7983251.1 DUF948 domain-containing protein [Sporosarcina quadrami]
MFVHIGVFLIAVSFAIFAIYLCKNLWRISIVGNSVSNTIIRMESSFLGTIQEVECVLDSTYVTATDVEAKVDALNGVFHTVGEIGNTAGMISEGLNDVTASYASSENTNGEKPFIRIIQGAEFAKGLVKSWKRGQEIN